MELCPKNDDSRCCLYHDRMEMCGGGDIWYERGMKKVGSSGMLLVVVVVGV